jgi:hypothetical protein
MDPFKTALGLENAAFENMEKSPETERIAEVDRQFDFTFAGMRDYAHSCLRHFGEKERYAAENLSVVFEKYGNIGLQPYRQELVLSHNLLEDLRKHSDEIETINLIPWMEIHEVAAKKLSDLLNKRTDDIAQQTSVQVRKIRREVDMIYTQITNRIEAMINLHGKDYVPGFVNKYNAHAIEYKNKYAQHIGRVQAGKNDKNEDKNNTGYNNFEDDMK